MERKFYPENFEKFLKGHADQFKLTPSKKVWHGIYNDLHPGRRWPSVAMSMLFIFTLVIIGHLNTNNGHNTALYDLNSLHASNIAKPIASKQSIKRSNTKLTITENNSTQNNNTGTDPFNVPQLSGINNTQASITIAGIPNMNESKFDNVVESKSNNVAPQNKNEILSSEKIEKNVIQTSPAEVSAINTSENSDKINNNEAPVIQATSNTTEVIYTPVEKAASIIPQANAATIHKPKRINNVTWTYYLAPSLSYRFLSDKDVSNAVIHKPIIGYEGGAAMSINIFKKLQFTTGLQLNYSGYNIRANNTHPTISTLILNTETAGQYSVYTSNSFYGNSTGSELTRLKNYSLQASVPIGLQYIFGGNDNIKFGAAAALQPTFIFTDKAYLLSTDRRNYLTAPELLRKWNMNANLTPYVTFNSNSFNWQIGPQVRYQFLSTYSNLYQVKEHLVNYGIRIGISKSSK